MNPCFIAHNSNKPRVASDFLFFSDDDFLKNTSSSRVYDRSIVRGKSQQPKQESKKTAILHCLAEYRAEYRIENHGSLREKLLFIAESFGLTARMFSSIYKVEKSTYYNWLNDQETKQSDKIKRINEIYTIAVKVSKFNSHRYGTKAKTFTPSLGRTLFDLLCDDELESSKIISVCRELTNVLKKWDNLSNASKHSNSYHHHTIVGFEHDE